MTNEERLQAAYDILSTDDAFESDQVIVDMANGRNVSQREFRLAKVVSSLYKIIHPAFGCEHRDWDKENENHLVSTCFSVDCPERCSVCCNAISEAISGDEGTGYFVCSSCKAEYIGGECNARKCLECNKEIESGNYCKLHSWGDNEFLPKPNDGEKVTKGG